MADTEALARVLADYRRTITDTDAVKVIDLHQAQQIVADPGPLLAALAEAGVLTGESRQRVKTVYEGGDPVDAVLVTEVRYVTYWQEDDRA